MFGLIIAAILSLPTASQSPSSTSLTQLEKQLNANLHDKILTLRTFSKNDHQYFDEDGQPKKQSEAGSWTIYSQVLVQKVDVSQSRVRLNGLRVIDHYDASLKKLRASRSDMKVEIDLDIKKDATEADIAASIAKIVVGSEGLSPLVPSYWRSYLGGGKKDEKANSNELGVRKVRVGGIIQGANLIKQVRPQYAEEAKRLLLQGVVVMEVEINETGDVGNISIVQPADAGFDESAVDAISQWKSLLAKIAPNRLDVR